MKRDEQTTTDRQTNEVQHLQVAAEGLHERSKVFIRTAVRSEELQEVSLRYA
jgi:IS5 family transposase